MKARELIEALQVADPEREVVIIDHDGVGTFYRHISAVECEDSPFDQYIKIGLEK
jgi:hypothetical protein